MSEDGLRGELQFSYSKHKPMEGFRRKCMGKIGSLAVLYVTHVSYSPKSKKSTMPVVSVPMITLLLHWYETPAS